MIQTLPLTPDDIAVTHLPGDVTVSTRAITHVGIRPGEEITNFETMILIPGGHVDGPDTRDRALAVGQHISVVTALLGGAALSSIGLVVMDEPDESTIQATEDEPEFCDRCGHDQHDDEACFTYVGDAAQVGVFTRSVMDRLSDQCPCGKD